MYTLENKGPDFGPTINKGKGPQEGPMVPTLDCR